jgi:hypothetical protein
MGSMSMFFIKQCWFKMLLYINIEEFFIIFFLNLSYFESNEIFM